MSMVRLERNDPARNMRRFHHLDRQPVLFGGFALIREWVRIGQAGRVREDLFESEDVASTAMERLRQAKLRRAYSPDILIAVRPR